MGVLDTFNHRRPNIRLALRLDRRVKPADGER